MGGGATADHRVDGVQCAMAKTKPNAIKDDVKSRNRWQDCGAMHYGYEITMDCDVNSDGSRENLDESETKLNDNRPVESVSTINGHTSSPRLTDGQIARALADGQPFSRRGKSRLAPATTSAPPMRYKATKQPALANGKTVVERVPQGPPSRTRQSLPNICAPVASVRTCLVSDHHERLDETTPTETTLRHGPSRHSHDPTGSDTGTPAACGSTCSLALSLVSVQVADRMVDSPGFETPSTGTAACSTASMNGGEEVCESGATMVPVNTMIDGLSVGLTRGDDRDASSICETEDGNDGGGGRSVVSAMDCVY
jgi:hypothetical protein